MVLRQCLQIKTDIEEIVYRLDRENSQLHWRKNKQGEQDIVSVITGKDRIFVIFWCLANLLPVWFIHNLLYNMGKKRYPYP